jgi:hypothetical protein
VSSMAAYSVFCYVLHVKDRHNGNILLCHDGAIAHVDFGIMLNVRYAKDVLELKIKLSSLPALRLGRWRIHICAWRV